MLVEGSDRVVLRLTDLPRVLQSFGVGRRREFLEPSTSDHSAAPEILEAYGVEVERFMCPINEFMGALARATPALIRLDDTSFLAVQSVSRKWVRVLDATGMKQSLRRGAFRKLVEGDRTDDDVIARLPSELRENAKKIHQENSTIDVWKLRRTTANGFLPLTRELHPVSFLFVMFFLGLISRITGLMSWITVGLFSLTDDAPTGSIWGWLLLILLPIPIGAVRSWVSAKFMLRFSMLFREYLFSGVLRISRDITRRFGSAEWLARIQQFEGAVAGVAGLPLLLVGLVTSLGVAFGMLIYAQNAWLIAVFTVAVLIQVPLGFYYFRATLELIEQELKVTTMLTEAVTGHLTRKVQGRVDEEERLLDQIFLNYESKIRKSWMYGVMANWCVPIYVTLSCLVIAIAHEPGAASGSAEAAVTVVAVVGAVYIAAGSLSSIVAIPRSLAALAIALKKLAVLYRAPVVFAEQQPASSTALSRETQAERMLIVRDLYHRYETRERPTLQGVNLEIHSGEKVMLHGASGGGKSTFAEIVAGLREPSEGTVLVGGYDREYLGDRGWERWVSMAPQFHQNHIFSGSFAFNLLLGRRWPGEPEDFEEAINLCEALGLGQLLSKMPSGINQLVGEGGWALSHGEKNRVFLARALLADTPLVLLDESVSALDPDSVQAALKYLESVDRTVILLAHA